MLSAGGGASGGLDDFETKIESDRQYSEVAVGECGRGLTTIRDRSPQVPSSCPTDRSLGSSAATTSVALVAMFFAACIAGGVSGPEMDGSAGSGGSPNASGGTTGSGGSASGAGGTIGSGGNASGGAPGSGGQMGDGGSGSGGAAGRGGTPGTGGIGTGGVTGTGGGAGRGGRGGTGAAGTTGNGGSPLPIAKFVGNIDTRGQVRSDFTMYWDQISPENSGKWGSVEGTRDQMNWAGLDRVYNYAKQNNLPFKQHTFVWGSQQPNWIGGLSQADQRAEVEEWIRLFCERYPDTRLIDVVNEPPPHTTPSYTAALGGAGASGYDWIVQAFKWARQYCPRAILILNDYNNIEYAADNNRMIDIVTKIKAAGAPIDAVGAQAHGTASMSTSTVQMYLDKLASSTGLPVYISEFDINIADDNQQKTVMQNHFTMFWNNPNVKGITLWGYIVGQTWVANSGLVTTSGTSRPAMTWLMDFLGR
jgi:endo-1,4-beta-xylanase